MLRDHKPPISSLEPEPLNVPPSTCVALVLRAVAAATTLSTEPITSDEATFRALEMPYGGLCGSRFLTQLTPREVIDALGAQALLGKRLRWPEPVGVWGQEDVLRF